MFKQILKPFVGVCILAILLTGCGENKSTVSSQLDKTTGLLRVLQTDWSMTPLQGAYDSPVDFDELHKTAPEAIGWLDLSQIGISYPIMYRPGDREFYLHHNERGEYAFAGSVYAEDYNHPDFTDFATVLYGHNMKNNTMFGYLEETYRTEQGFEKGKQFSVYLPKKALLYEVVGAVHHNNKHVLMNRDFNKDGAKTKWLQDMLGTADGRFNSNITWNEEDRYLVLATCTYTKEKRYLVIAKLIDEQGRDNRIILTDCFAKRCIRPM